MNIQQRTIKIRSQWNTNLELTNSTHSGYTQKFDNFLIDADEYFRSLVMLPINERIGLFNWAIDFRENPGNGFKVDIFCNNECDFQLIYTIIISCMPDLKFLFIKNGPINTEAV